jgi:hypothetical protein
MWSDNETAVDLLGFEYLVDELEILLTERRLLPVTVGVNGDWGSGKTSLMRIARERLESGENAGRFIPVAFSPWRFEDYHDAKAALMAAVVDAIAERVEQDEGLKQKAGTFLNRVRDRLHDWGVFRSAASVGTALAGGGPEEVAAAGTVTDAVTGIGPDPDAPKYQRSFETVAHFHEEFADLMHSLGDEIQAVVVFIDDMDRCRTNAIVQTFEAIGLFLFAEKTAYVVGANEAIVEAALEGRYPVRREGDEDIAQHYLEKMLQNSITIPPLSEPEARTYINLLYAELYATDEQFALLRSAASENRTKNQLAVAMNEGIARTVIGDLPAELAQALDVAERIGSPLARGLRGNPRQIKRFLNRLRLRQQAADRRGLGLDPAKLAKLMVLEELHVGDFEQLFHWQLEADGVPPQLRVAEALARDEKPQEQLAEAESWLIQPGIREWLLLEPRLAGEVLGPYYTFSRDRLKRTVSAARLPLELQRLLVGLQSDLEPTREKAIADVAQLERPQLAELLAPLVQAATADLGSGAAKALVALAETDADVATALFNSLDALPESKVKPNFVLLLRVKFKEDERLAPLLARWEAKGGTAVKRQARRSRQREQG